MGDHVIVCPENRLKTSDQGCSSSRGHIAIPIEELSASLEAATARDKRPAIDDNDNVQQPEEDDELTGDKEECRFCHDEDYVSKLEAPCSCDGTLKYAHRSCIQRWCTMKGNIICVICLQPYHPNYTVTEPPPEDNELSFFNDGWTIPGTNTYIPSPLLLAERASNRFSAAMNDDFNLRNPSGGVLFGTGLLVFFALLIMRDIYYYTPPKDDDKIAHYIYCGLMIVLVPFYILSWIFECRVLRDYVRERANERDWTA